MSRRLLLMVFLVFAFRAALCGIPAGKVCRPFLFWGKSIEIKPHRGRGVALWEDHGAHLVCFWR